MTDQPLILLVDDEPDILVALQDLFEDQYRILAANSGQGGLEALRANPDVALIISDQRMPGMTGDAFLREARQVSDAGAILLTGYADLSAVVAALNEGGIIGYAAKPWEPEGLRAMVAGAVEQRRLRLALAREQALLRGLMDHIPAEVAFKDREGRLVQANNRKAEALGEGEQNGLSALEAEALARGEPVKATSESVSGQSMKWSETEVVPITDDAGQVSHLAVIGRDVTAQKIAEIQLRQSDKLRALGTLAGGVAHDFNNLLAAILGSLELAGRRLKDPAALQRYIGNATKAAQRGASLTQRLLGFSRQTDSRASLVDLGAVLAGARDLMGQTLGSGIEVTWETQPELWPAVLEPDQLELALLNLGVNARDAMGAAGRIHVTARNHVQPHTHETLGLGPGDYVKVTVADEGHGMPPEVLARVMEPFFTTKAPGKGTGLGLPMVYSFVQRSGGALQIESDPGQGTRVSIYLPRGDSDAGFALMSPAAQPAGDDRKLTVLVVDDEDIVRSVTAEFLRDLGHEVLEAADGREALEAMQNHRHRIDLAVVDFAMPGMNGVDLAVAARARRPDLPVILLTGYFDLDAVPTDISIMHKPFTDAGLLEAISAAVQARG